MTNEPEISDEMVSISRAISMQTREISSMLYSIKEELESVEPGCENDSHEQLKSKLAEMEITEEELSSYTDVESIVKQMDNADQALDALESRFDILNGKLDEILDSLSKVDYQSNSKNEGNQSTMPEESSNGKPEIEWKSNIFVRLVIITMYSNQCVLILRVYHLQLPNSLNCLFPLTYIKFLPIFKYSLFYYYFLLWYILLY